MKQFPKIRKSQKKQDDTPKLRSELRSADMLRIGALGLESRPGRTILTAIGISVGIASIVAVLGISASSKAELLRTLDKLGTNLLRVTASKTLQGGSTNLPADSTSMAERIAPVEDTAAVTSVPASVRRTSFIPAAETGGISIMAATTDLADTLVLDLAAGRFFDEATAQLPTAVLGSKAAERLGITGRTLGTRMAPRVFVDGNWLTVIGILTPSELHSDIDRSLFMGYPIARSLYGTSSIPTTLFVRTDPDQVPAAFDMLPRTVSPQNPRKVRVSRPSDILIAKEEADKQLTNLLVGLGGVALFVGGLAIANVMVMSILERRVEIGVRRALGATKQHIRQQFVMESIALSGIGGIAGVALGTLVTALYATNRGFPMSVPLIGLFGSIFAALLIGAVAGFYPATRAANIPPSEAVRSGA